MTGIKEPKSSYNHIPAIVSSLFQLTAPLVFSSLHFLKEPGLIVVNGRGSDVNALLFRRNCLVDGHGGKLDTAAVGVTVGEEKVSSTVLCNFYPSVFGNGSVLILLGNLNQGNELEGVQNEGIKGSFSRWQSGLGEVNCSRKVDGKAGRVN